MRLHAKILALSLVLSGCSAIVDPAAKDPMKTAQGFCNSVQDVYARLMAQCGGYDAGYVDAVMQSIRSGCANVGSADSQGMFSYDQALAEQCMASLQASNCNSDIYTAIQFCSLALTGTVPPGGACTSMYSMLNECAGTARCYSPSGTCPGTCIAPGQLGQPCAVAGPQCAGGLVCDGNGYCSNPGNLGDRCDFPYPACNGAYYYCSNALSPPTCQYLPPYGAGPCNLTGYACATGYTCVYDAMIPGYTCKSPSAHGADCSQTGTCVAGDYCRYIPSTSSHTCWTIPSGIQGIGGDCYRAGSNWTNFCAAGLFCDYNSDYSCEPILNAGSPCTSSDQCGPGATCSKLDSESSGTCTVLKTSGQQCRAGAGECLRGLWCQGSFAGSVGVCRALPGSGGACGYPYYSAGAYNEYVECAEGNYCQEPPGAYSGTCQPFVPVGGSCIIGGNTYYNACGYLTGSYCDTNSSSPTYGTCVANACTVPLGWFPGGS